MYGFLTKAQRYISRMKNDKKTRSMKPTQKQLRAYYLVRVMGESMAKAGKIMGGITRQAVSGLLARCAKNCQRPKKKRKYLN